MAFDPYRILEIDRTASDDEVKRAYRELAKKYHPDNFKDNPLSDLASEKMKQINEAYDTIQRERATKSNGYGNNNYNNGNTYGGNSDSSFYRVRELINENRYSEAEIILDSANQYDKNAEWHYLKGVVLTKRGWYFDAQKNFQTACNLDPNNAEYREALYSTKNKSNNYYKKGYNMNGGAHNSGCSGCDMCTGLICADCLCECLGGDLIRCC